MTPYEEGQAIARDPSKPAPPIPKGNATWAEKLRNRGFLDAKAEMATKQKD